MSLYTVTLERATGARTVLGASTTAEHAREIARQLRCEYPRAHAVGAYAPNGVRLLKLYRRSN